MSNTLRRKMFKLGGSANTHGVGITSGLKMNKGGRVGFQPGGIVGIDPKSPTGGEILANLLNPSRLSTQGFNISTPQAAFVRTNIGGQSLLPAEGVTGSIDETFNNFLEANPELAFEYFRGLAQKETPTTKVQQFFGAPETRFGLDRDDVKEGLTKFGELKDKPFTDEGLLGNPYLRGRGDLTSSSMLSLLDEAEQKRDIEKREEARKEDQDVFAEAIKDAAGTEKVPTLSEQKIQEAIKEKQAEQVDEERNAVKEIAGDDAIDLDEDVDLSFEDEVKQRAEALQGLYQTDSRQKVLSELLLKASAPLLEGKGAESYAEAARQAGDVLTQQANRLRDVKNAVTTQAISDITAKEAAELQAKSLEDRAQLQADTSIDVATIGAEAQIEATRNRILAQNQIAEADRTSKEMIAANRIDAAQGNEFVAAVTTLSENYDRPLDKYYELFQGTTMMPLYETNSIKDGKKIKSTDEILDLPATSRINTTLFKENTIYSLNGAFYVTDENNKLSGPFTDIDTARNLLVSK